mmetsp:Transcript_8920/g.26400  ORF Transcript_8920/g.26400 Transcript_8920/m.26400 type:complete len:240 (+) Transcript_8920:591-1310(+)
MPSRVANGCRGCCARSRLRLRRKCRGLRSGCRGTSHHVIRLSTGQCKTKRGCRRSECFDTLISQGVSCAATCCLTQRRWCPPRRRQARSQRRSCTGCAIVVRCFFRSPLFASSIRTRRTTRSTARGASCLLIGSTPSWCRMRQLPTSSAMLQRASPSRRARRAGPSPCGVRRVVDHYSTLTACGRGLRGIGMDRSGQSSDRGGACCMNRELKLPSFGRATANWTGRGRRASVSLTLSQS